MHGGGGHAGGGFGGGHHGPGGVASTGAPLLFGNRANPFLVWSNGEVWTGRKQTIGRVAVGLVLGALLLIIVLVQTGAV